MKKYPDINIKLKNLSAKIDLLRNILNETYINENVDFDQKLRVSMEMDKLLNKYNKLYISICNEKKVINYNLGELRYAKTKVF